MIETNWYLSHKGSESEMFQQREGRGTLKILDKNSFSAWEITRFKLPCIIFKLPCIMISSNSHVLWSLQTPMYYDLFKLPCIIISSNSHVLWSLQTLMHVFSLCIGPRTNSRREEYIGQTGKPYIWTIQGVSKMVIQI
jgi:hypothetical protein